jgi:hypothetical protein
MRAVLGRLLASFVLIVSALVLAPCQLSPTAVRPVRS